MSDDLTQRARDVFDKALDMPVVERDAFVDEVCDNDPTLAAEVRALLQAFQQAEEFLETPRRLETEACAPAAGTMVGREIGRYKIRRLIATGGMGSVYEAQQEQPRRSVALKLMRRGITTRSALKRFEYEAQLLGRLRHPNIAQIYEAGTHDDGSGGVPYFAMEYIPRATPITEHALRNRLTVNRRLELFLPVCDAVHHGHQKGIIHRDLKPSNILVDSGGQPKIIDFGVARSTDSDMALTTMQTSVGQLVGTLQYMSPEQCAADPHDLDTRSDVYAMGVVLYELLCDKLPYEILRAPVHEATRIIREQNPSRLSSINRSLRGDVETIVLKALEKDRERRYHSASELGEDIRRYLRGSAIMARPPSAAYQLRVFARRHKGLVGALAAVFAVLVVGIIVSTSQYVRAERKADEAMAVNAFFHDMLASIDPMQLHTLKGVAPGGEITPATAGSLGHNITVAEMMRRASQLVQQRFGGQPELEAAARERIGMTFKGLGMEAEARPHLQEALAIRRNRLGDDHPDSWRSMLQLATYSFMDKGESHPAQDLPLARIAFDGLQQAYGPEDPRTLAAARVLADTLSSRRQYEKSETLFRRTADIQRRVLGDEHRETLLTELYWAQSSDDQNNPAQRDRLTFAVYDIARRTLGAADYVLLFAEDMAAYCYWVRGDFDRSRRLFERVLEKCRSSFGENHMWTLWAMRMAAASWPGAEHWERREQVYRHALAGLSERLGENHGEVSYSRHYIGVLLLCTGRYDEALDYLRDKPDLLQCALQGAGRTDEARRILLDRRAQLQVAARRPDAPAEMLARYAWMLLTCEPADLREPEQALAAARRAVALGDTQDPYASEMLATCHEDSEHPEIALRLRRQALDALPRGDSWIRTMLEINLLQVLNETGQGDAVREMRRRQFEHLRRTHGEAQALLEQQLTDLVLRFRLHELRLHVPLSPIISIRLLLSHGKRGTFDRLCDDITRLRRGVVPATETGVAPAVVSLARDLIKDGDHGQAASLLRAHISIQETALPEGSWRLAEARSLVAAAMMAGNQLHQAEFLLLDAFEVLSGDPQSPGVLRMEVAGRLATLYDALGQADKATLWRQRERLVE